MEAAAAYRTARRDEALARLRRVIALRAMAAAGMSQRQIAESLGVSQPAVNQQLKSAPILKDVHPEFLLEAAAPILKALADEHGYSDLAAFGSVARGHARQDSDIDLLVKAPAGTSSFAFIRFKLLIENILDREIDLVSYGGLQQDRDGDILREAVAL